jgi:hypothetical protein
MIPILYDIRINLNTVLLVHKMYVSFQHRNNSFAPFLSLFSIILCCHFYIMQATEDYRCL